MIATTRSYRLPDGTTVHSQTKYLKAWDDLIRPVAENLGMEAYGFDPGISLTSKQGILQLPLWVVRKLYASWGLVYPGATQERATENPDQLIDFETGQVMSPGYDWRSNGGKDW